MNSVELLQPVLEGGLRSVRFFNGRLLTSEDLSQEQNANREGLRRLAQAMGDGVASGLEVSETAGSTPAVPVLNIKAGLAVNRLGQTLKLSTQTDVSLVRQSFADQGSGGSSIFKDCQQFQAGVYVAGAGVYLLTICPAQGSEGRVSASGLGNNPVTCNTRYNVEGIQFRLLQLNLPNAELSNIELLRNRIAYRCFGVEDLKWTAGNPLGLQPENYGLLDALRPDTLTDCDVPLAVLYWTATGGVQFVDMWSVRRRLTAPGHGGRWSLLSDDRRASESEAMWQQFQEQVDELVARPNPEMFKATSFFQYLPPIGLLPLKTSTLKGFNPATFFAGRILPPPSYIDAAELRALFMQAAWHDPVELAKGEAFWVYRVWQNAQDAAANSGVQPCLVFTSPCMNRVGASRFDVARFDLSTFNWPHTLPGEA